MATQRQVKKVRELESEGFVVIGRRVIGISGRQIFEMERNSSVIQVTANGRVK
jgi:hypothetical protein